MIIKKVFIFLLGIICMSAVLAAPSDPVNMLEQTSTQMIDSLKENKATIKSNPTYVEGLARKILLPHVDVPTMSRLALGREAWSSASLDEKKQFMQQFVTMLIRTYGTALASYTDQRIVFLPLRGGVADQTRLEVYSKIIQSGGPSIPLSYRLVKRDEDWLVYDMSVDGVSLIQSFRSQFANQISQGGMTGLLTAMQQHNVQLGTK